MGYYEDKKKMSIRIDNALRDLPRGSQLDVKTLFYNISLEVGLSEAAFYKQLKKAVDRYRLSYDDEENVVIKEVKE